MLMVFGMPEECRGNKAVLNLNFVDEPLQRSLASLSTPIHELR